MFACSLARPGKEVDSRDKLDRSPLHVASESRLGHLRLAIALANYGANVNTRQENHYSSTPLDLSAWNGHFGIVKLLLEHGADVQ
jgi:ankyrin repeat protein